MKFMSGWTWYCEYHNSFGIGDTQSEIQHMANAHVNFHIKSGNPCQMFFKNQEDPSNSFQLQSDSIEQSPKQSTYMARVKENFSRAWQKWDESEERMLIERFDSRKNLQELSQLHQRAEGGIVSRLKKLKLLAEDLDVNEASRLMANRHELLIKRKTFGGHLYTANTDLSGKRFDRGKESLAEFGTVNPPPIPPVDLKHTSLFACTVCKNPVVGNSCLCRGD